MKTRSRTRETQNNRRKKKHFYDSCDTLKHIFKTLLDGDAVPPLVLPSSVRQHDGLDFSGSGQFQSCFWWLVTVQNRLARMKNTGEEEEERSDGDLSRTGAAAGHRQRALLKRSRFLLFIRIILPFVSQLVATYY